MEHLSLDVLRTFLSIVDLKGFNKAAEKVHLTQSAISMQMKKLEEMTGQSLFERKGKQQVLTNQGEVLLSYARKMLELNDEVFLTLGESRLKGKIRVGIQWDFALSALPDSIYKYVKHHSEVMLELKVDSSDILQDLLARRKLDLILYLGKDRHREFESQVLGSFALEWMSSPAYRVLPFDQSPLPLAVLGANCKIRQSMSTALTEARIPWRIAFTTSSLSVAWGAVSAGIGVCARTRIGMPRSLTAIPKSAGLPALPGVHAYLCSSAGEKSLLVDRLKDFLLTESNRNNWLHKYSNINTD